MHAWRSDPDALTPVIIIPSLIGSVLTATLKDFNGSYFYCPKTWNDPFYLWMDDSDGFLFYLNCWFEHMTLQFDPHTNVSASAPGIISLPFGHTDPPETFSQLFRFRFASVPSPQIPLTNPLSHNRCKCIYQGLRRCARSWLHGFRSHYGDVERYHCSSDISRLWNWYLLSVFLPHNQTYPLFYVK